MQFLFAGYVFLILVLGFVIVMKKGKLGGIEIFSCFKIITSH